jgi:hypothetical protein
MPKVSNTRKQRALELLRRMHDGPAFGFTGQTMKPDEVSEDYKTWVRSWILFEIIQLVPELRTMHKRGKINTRGEPTGGKNDL